MARKKPLNHIAKLVLEAFKRSGLDACYIGSAEIELRQHKDKYETLVWCIKLDGQNMGHLADLLGVNFADLRTTIRMLARKI